ncbi:MAG: malate dehydrogenase [Candidatus Omnitrophota bacterium]|nr:malate dehydrogenase [Candidatus Omnitrophota bacterium]
MKKITVIGAGNVGGLTAMRLSENNLGQVLLIDIAKNLALAKASDMEDARYAAGNDYSISATDDFGALSGSDIVVVTAGFARRPGMKREELLAKNAQIINDIALSVKQSARDAICIIVTNPVDVMTYLFLNKVKTDRRRIFGMGGGLDSSRFANLIAKKLNLAVSDIKPVVIGAHGEDMLALSRLTMVKGKPLTSLISSEASKELEKETVGRGAEIVGLYGSGSAYFAPSAAILQIVKAIINDTNEAIYVSVCLEGEYGITGVSVGVPAKIGKNGISEIPKLDLTKEELLSLQKSAAAIKNSMKDLP